MVNIAAENEFTKMVLELEKRVDALQERALEGEDDPHYLIKDAEGYESGIKLAYQHAEQHNISIRLYYDQFLRIENKLRSIKDTIDKMIHSWAYQASQSYAQGYARGTRLFNQESDEFRSPPSDSRSYYRPVKYYGGYNVVSYQAPQERLPRWRKALGFVMGAISVVANIISLFTPFIPMPLWTPFKMLK
jgi:hypothetical protein